MHLLMADKAHNRPGAFHSRHIGFGKGNLHTNGIDKHAGAGTRVKFDGARNLEGDHLLIWALYILLEQWDLSPLTVLRLNALKCPTCM